MFIKKFQVLTSGIKTMLNCSRLRNSYHQVCKLLIDSRGSATKPLLPKKWFNTPRMTTYMYCQCSKLEQQSLKIASSLSFYLVKRLESALNSKTFIINETTHSYDLSNTTSFNVIIRNLCTNTNFTKKDNPQILLCDTNISIDFQPSRCYSTKSKNINDDVDSWEMLVDYEKLSPTELKIHERHRDAVKQGKTMYVDPLTGYQVMTRLAHLERGDCCGNACRHCPYGQSKVMEEKNKETFNSAFYV